MEAEKTEIHGELGEIYSRRAELMNEDDLSLFETLLEKQLVTLGEDLRDGFEQEVSVRNYSDPGDLEFMVFPTIHSIGEESGSSAHRIISSRFLVVGQERQSLYRFDFCVVPVDLCESVAAGEEPEEVRYITLYVKIK